MVHVPIYNWKFRNKIKFSEGEMTTNIYILVDAFGSIWFLEMKQKFFIHVSITAVRFYQDIDRNSEILSDVLLKRTTKCRDINCLLEPICKIIIR